MDIFKYWQEVKIAVEKLPEPAKADNGRPVYYVVSLDNPEKGTVAGVVCDMSDKKEVARRLVERTHRLAEPSEIERFHREQKRQTEELAEIELKRKQQFAMPQELQTLVHAAAQSMLRDDGRKNKEK